MSNVTQRNFAGGELSSSLYGRTDMSKYQTGLRTCRNMMVQRHGGVTNRSGTEFTTEVKDSNKAVHFIRFAFSTAQTYLLEFGDLYMRVIRLGAPITVSGVTAWNAATNYVIGDLASRLGVNYYCILAHINQQPPNATYWYPLVGSIYEIPTPYVLADLPFLQYVQSADVLTITHPSYVPRELRRTAHTTWTLTPITFTPSIPPPTAINNPTGGSAGGPTEEWSWAVTAIKAETGEESLPVLGISFTNRVPSEGVPVNITWDAVAGAQAYNIYRSRDYGNTYGWVGYSLTAVFQDSGAVPDLLSAPPIARDPFNAVDKYPAVVSFFQQRRLFAQSNGEPEKIWGSRTGHYNNFTTTFPVQDDDSVTFNLSGRQINAVKHLVDVGKLIIFTEDGEWLVEGDQAGILRPGEINPRQVSYNGASSLPPVIIGDAPIYVQARGTIVRDFRPNPLADYPGNDLTVFAAHLFDGYTLVDMDYQENPQSIMWAVRSDGVLLGLTYLPEHAVWGWHRHDTDGFVENVCVIPEGAEDKLYLCVRRTINGVTKRYIERLSARYFTDIRNAIFMDSTLSYDGRNVSATTMTISTNDGWNYNDSLVLSRSAGNFVAGDVGNAIFIYELDANGVVLDEVRLTIITFFDAANVYVRANKTIPVNLRNSARTSWSMAVDSFSGLAHLEGKDVSIIGDGFVIASPNNADYPVFTVVAGAITLDRAYAMVHVGLPYLSDIETLDVDTPSGPSLKESRFLINRVRLFIEKSRGIWSGRALPTGSDPLEGLNEVKPRSNENPNLPPQLVTDDVDVNIESNWDSNGRMVVRQVDPVPLTILAAIPQGYIP